MLKSWMTGVILLLVARPLMGQAACRANVDSLFSKLEQNYAALRLEVTGDRRVQYDRLKVSAAKEADGTTESGCYPVLHRVTTWFNDPHLFVFQAERLDSLETRRRMERVERRDIDETALRADLLRRGKKADPIEGIWYDKELRIAVVPDTGRKDRYVAVVLTSDTSTWKVGDVRARLTRRATGMYDVTLATRDHATRQIDATLHRRVMLRLSPGIWGKEFPVAPADSGAIDPVDVHRATWRSYGETAVLAIPSHDPSYVSTLQQIGKEREAELKTLKYLVIDLRGNEGGSSWMTMPLYPLIRSNPKRPSPYDGDEAVMLSSPVQIAYAKRAFGADTSPFVRSLVARMEAKPGLFVELNDPAAPKTEDPPAEIAERPLRVAVLVDRGTVSASEVLVLEALRSTRAVVIGEPTAGALDYQSVYLVRLAPKEDRWYVGYPTITRNLHLPKGGMRGKGIMPDVVVKWDGVTDDLGAVMMILRK